MTVQERVIKNAIETDECLRWPGAEKKNGRPYLQINGKYRNAYRALYEEVVGPIPKGLTIDHTCNNKYCLNINHLEPVTHEENYKRFNKMYQEANPNFVCGHPKTGDILYNKRKGKKPQRRCRPCTLAYQKEYYRTHRKEDNAAADNLH